MNDTQALFVQDDSPRGEHFYRARFYFGPGDFDPGEAEGRFRTRLFVGFDSNPTRRLFAVVLRRVGGEYSLMARTRRDHGTRLDTGFVPIAPGAHLVDVRWTRSSGVDTADGTLELWIDGVPTVVGGIDNDQGAPDFVRLGALSVKAGASGTMYWDEFESHRALIYHPAASARQARRAAFDEGRGRVVVSRLPRRQKREATTCSKAPRARRPPSSSARSS